MSSVQNLMGVGMPASQALAVGQSLATGLSGAGTSSKSDATLMSAGLNVFSTVSANQGARLPPPSGSPMIVVVNGGASPLLVYSNGSDTINALSAGGSFSVTNAKVAIFIPSDSKWGAILSA